MKKLFVAGAILFAGLSARAAGPDAKLDTKTYLPPLAESLKQTLKFSRWSRVMDAFRREEKLTRDPLFGRVEAALVFNFALAGVELKKQGDHALGDQYIKAALDNLRMFNKILDNPDLFRSPTNMNDGSIGQVGVVVPEIVMAARALRDNGFLKGEDLKRTNQLLELLSDHWMKYEPQVGMSGMSNWNNRHGLGPLMTANFFASQPNVAAEKADKIKAYRRYAAAVLLRSADYPYGYRLLPGGKLAPAVLIQRGGKEDPAPAGRTPYFGITENSSHYNADSMFTFLMLLSEMPPEEVPQITPARMRQLCSYLKDWQSMIAPNGAVPTYSDSHWAPGALWGAVFELAAKIFADREKYGDAAAGFKATALALHNYHQKYCGNVESRLLPKAMIHSVYSGEAKRAPETSRVVVMQDHLGKQQPSKIILRGGTDGSTFAMFQTFHNSSHSHGDFGCLCFFGVGDKVLQHEHGYDAGEIFFHQQLLIRPADEGFIPFAQVFQDPKETVLVKGRKGLPVAFHRFKSTSFDDKPEYSFACIDTDYRTSFKDQPKVDFSVKRQAVLDKKSNALIVFDTAINDRNVKLPVALSPVWHVQNVLEKRADGFVCSDDAQGGYLRDKVTLGIPSGPYWVGMKGPEGFAPENLTWKFVSKARRNDIPQKEHLYLKGSKTLERNGVAGFVSVLMPLEKASLSEAPAKIKIDGNQAQVDIDGRRYRFSPNGVTLGAAK